MTTFYVEQLRCRRCEQQIATQAVGSCNTIGATFYTDGFVEGPMWVEDSALLECPGCGAVQWQDEFERINDAGGRRAIFADSLWLPFARFPALLADAPWRDRDEEAYVRVRAWWAGNGPRRGSENPPALSDAERANLGRLLELVAGDEQQERIMRAEILRELGRYEDCLAALEPVSDPDLADYRDRIRQLAEQGRWAVGAVADLSQPG